MGQAMAKKKAKTFMGMPMNWDRNRPFRNTWNPDSSDIIAPKSFGIGWTINLHAVGRKMGLIKVGGPKNEAEVFFAK